MKEYLDNEFLNEMIKALDIVQVDLMQATGGKSVCFLHKYSKSDEKVKYFEGKEYIIRVVVNQLKKDLALDNLQKILEEYRGKLETIRDSKLGVAPDWKAYVEGGFEGLELTKGFIKRNMYSG